MVRYFSIVSAWVVLLLFFDGTFSRVFRIFEVPGESFSSFWP